MSAIDRLRLELELAREKRLLAEIQLKTTEARGEKRKRSKKDKGKEKVKEKEKEKGKEKEKEKEKEKKEVSDEAGEEEDTLRCHGLTKNKVTISDLTHKNNRVVFNIIQAVREEKRKGEGLEKYDALVEMVAEAIKKGLKAPFYNPDLLPEGVLSDAKELVRNEVGDEAFESEVNTDTDSETLETFHGDFVNQSITSDDWPGESYHADIAFIRPSLERELRKVLKTHKRIRFFLTYKCLMVKMRMNLIRGETNGTTHIEEIEESRVANIKSGYMQTLTIEKDISDLVDAAFFILEAEMDKYTENGSGFRWIKSISLDLSFSRFVAGLGANSRTASVEFRGLTELKGGKWVKLPKWLRNRQVYNPKRGKRDERCFVWAILRSLYPPQVGTNEEIVRRCDDIAMRFHEVLLPEGLKFPVECTSRTMRTIEELNNFSLSVFLLGQREYEVRPLYVTKKKKEKHIMLGLIEGDNTMHCVGIKELSRVVAPFYKSKRFFCENCFSPHQSEPALKKHEEECMANEPTRIKMPKPGMKDHFITFKEWRYKLPAPFTLYADFEALLKQPRATAGANVFSRHKPIAWAYYIQCHYESHKEVKGVRGKPLGEVRTYCGQNAIHQFLEDLAHDAEVCEGIVKSLEHSKYRGEISQEYIEADTCHICGKGDFNRLEPKKYKVLDHDHITGLYRGAAHMNCNFQYYSAKNWRLPIFFHNLKGYDGYHMLKGLEGYVDGIENMNCIARSLDKFTSFQIDNMRFSDSNQFLLGTLDANVEGLKKGLSLQQMKEAFEPVVTHFGVQDDDEKFNLLMGKGIYPYEYMSKMEVVKETKLPPKEAFFSNLQGKGVSDEDHERAELCFEKFGCKNLEDYTMMYVVLDVLQLASCFEKLRRTCLKPGNLELDPAHFITAPSLSWSAMLLHACFKNDIRIENMTDLEMMYMTQKGVRGGMCMVMNPRLVTSDTRKGFYWDANNLYGWAMSRPLPIGDYRWEKQIDHPSRRLDDNEEEFLLSTDNLPQDVQTQSQNLPMIEDYELWHREDVGSIAEAILEMDVEGERGYVLEVDVEYPKELHDEHNDLPFFPQKKGCEPSPYTVEQMKRVYSTYGNGKLPPSGEKLVLDLTNKESYVVHIAVLKEALRHGLKLKKVHRVFSFKQSRWLKVYIDFCTRMRAAAQDEAERNAWKLMANSIYGKTVEDVRRRREVEIVHGEKARERALRIGSSPWIKNFRVVIPNQLLLVEKFKRVCTLNRPTIIGFSVLELSKLHMYNWHYNTVRAEFGDRAVLHYMDTDSTVYTITGEDIYRDLNRLQCEKECFDIGKLKKAFPQHPLAVDLGFGEPTTQENELGKFKDEMTGIEIDNAIFLRPKSYSIMVKGGKTHTRMKGVPKKATLPNGEHIDHHHFLEVWKQGTLPKVKFQKIDHTKSFEVVTTEVEKIGLTNTDDKSFYFNGWECLRYGHWRIEDFMNSEA